MDIEENQRQPPRNAPPKNALARYCAGLLQIAIFFILLVISSCTPATFSDMAEGDIYGPPTYPYVLVRLPFTVENLAPDLLFVLSLVLILYWFPVDARKGCTALLAVLLVNAYQFGLIALVASVVTWPTLSAAMASGGAIKCDAWGDPIASSSRLNRNALSTPWLLNGGFWLTWGPLVALLIKASILPLAISQVNLEGPPTSWATTLLVTAALFNIGIYIAANYGFRRLQAAGHACRKASWITTVIFMFNLYQDFLSLLWVIIEMLRPYY